MRWTAVVNPTAGRGRTKALIPDLERALHEHDATVHVSTDAADGRRAAGAAFARGDGVIACGGDGTIADLAALAADEAAPLAIVPSGSGNDFARHLGIDHRQPLDAVALLDTGRLAAIDLGVATTHDGTSTTFTTIANTGFDAEANRWANTVRWTGGTTLYVLAMLRTLMRYRPVPTRVQTTDDEWSGPAWLVAVGNTRSYAGGMQITPKAEVDDGLLDVCIVTGVATVELLRRFPRVFRGTHTELDEVITLRGATVSVAALGADAGSAELWASGERVGPLPAHLASRRGALRVLVPPGSPLTRP